MRSRVNRSQNKQNATSTKISTEYTYQTESYNTRGKSSYNTHFSTSGPNAVQRAPGKAEEGVIIKRNSRIDLDDTGVKTKTYTYTEGGEIDLKKFTVKQPISNFLYYESNAGFTKDKGEEVSTTYKSRKGTYTTIVRSPKFSPKPIYIPRKEIKEVTTVQQGKNMVFFDSNTGYKEDRGTTQVKKRTSVVGFTGGEIRYSLKP